MLVPQLKFRYDNKIIFGLHQVKEPFFELERIKSDRSIRGCPVNFYNNLFDPQGLENVLGPASGYHDFVHNQ